MKNITSSRIIVIIIVVCLVVAAGYLLLRTSRTSDADAPGQSVTANEESALPAGVTQYSVDSVGPFVARSAYAIDLDRDNTANDTILRTSHAALSQDFITRLHKDSTMSLFVVGTRFEQFRNEGVTHFVPSTAISDDEKSEQSESRASRTYDLSTTPVFEDGEKGSSINITITMTFVRQANNWFVDSITQR